MDKEMIGRFGGWLENPLVETLAFFSIAILSLIVFLTLFEVVTKYNAWKEVKSGNVAVAMAVGGKIFGICNIFRYALLAGHDSIYKAFLWAGYGFILLLLAYFIFEFLIPLFTVDEQLQQDNRAVGFISMMISVSLSYIIGASIL